MEHARDFSKRSYGRENADAKGRQGRRVGDTRIACTRHAQEAKTPILNLVLPPPLAQPRREKENPGTKREEMIKNKMENETDRKRPAPKAL